MAYNATAIPVMIASPGDLYEERRIVRDVIHEWNDIHSMQRNFVLMPAGWDTHSSPDLSDKPQALINKNVLKDCDLLVGVFWTRLGTPTDDAESGTAEEIRKHVESGKPAMVYFSTAPVSPDTIDIEQYKALKQFKVWCQKKGITWDYENISAFAELFRRHLQIIIRDNSYLKTVLPNDTSNKPKQSRDDSVTVGNFLDNISTHAKSVSGISIEAQELLQEACKDPNGRIISMRLMSGQVIQANNINFANSNDRRSVARWEAALEQLLNVGLVIARGQKNEIFEVTDSGYSFADSLQKSKG